MAIAQVNQVKWIILFWNTENPDKSGSEKSYQREFEVYFCLENKKINWSKKNHFVKTKMTQTLPIRFQEHLQVSFNHQFHNYFSHSVWYEKFHDRKSWMECETKRLKEKCVRKQNIFNLTEKYFFSISLKYVSSSLSSQCFDSIAMCDSLCMCACVFLQRSIESIRVVLCACAKADNLYCVQSQFCVCMCM